MALTASSPGSDSKVQPRITVRGKVQKAMFRDFVKELAKKHGLYGFVQNLTNYEEDVLVVCEGEKQDVEGFLKELSCLKDSQKHKQEEMLIRIDETRSEYGKYEGAFTNFEVVHKEGEMGERIEEGAKQIMALRRETKTNFSKMDEKYGEISEVIKELAEEFVESNKTNRKLVESLIKKLESK